MPGPTTVTILPQMNHLLRDYAGTHHLLNLAKEYKQSVKDDLSESLLQAILNWLNANSSKISG